MLTFAGRGTVLVVGDVMLDRYIHGHAGRLSPEAPVPVLAWDRQQDVPGGAANVAANIAALGGSVRLLGVTGADATAADLAAVLAGWSETLMSALVADPARPTTLKTRFVSHGQQLLRLDREDARDLDATAQTMLLDRFEALQPGSGVVVLSDYRKGTLTPDIIGAVVARSIAQGCPVIVDPKRPDWTPYRGATLITPNRSELEQATGLPCNSDTEVEAAARYAMAATGAAILVTRSERGMSLVAPDRPVLHVPAQAREVFDVSGAGDTVVAVLAASLAAGLDLGEAVSLANVAAGLVVTKHGTATLSIGELTQALRAEPTAASEAISRAEAVRLRAVWRQQGHRVGFTNGCFDILHPGHVRLLREAASRCDRLVVGLNTDASVRRLKGPTRPVQGQDARTTVMAALGCVDAVVLFDEDTPYELIRALEPDLLVKGADYREDQVVGADFVKQRGGSVALIDLVDDQSTSAIVARSRPNG
ncbi:bifunctional D-glycero-beta-D-manno-heptose-7-phosphate kinase/D-glycero-beta-D-manno-heptose 1-phosphate adenylyltransferase HldE [Lichenihabitans sp. Uapishka_5]|uniref:bifunctional D-glycero-beta-D-manno-heptose-7-phosphate kinase/D-glycero-beta-D-manno-heptose 1-phosphate adenylyltransferase HldE n=1 Tax=Lichenihabitans sp. Uapishka_5 TaxID=3037302 RepID=UPI0029E7F127|nr:bifunctional D-glycero-beta-D-manno-heptose-7-phosphate kinase/D-glycero-beta-D-manno-heptose 1-phosphate adenylyltransferase HldE [Lichenihabitans sp. Uapishka_5]MDX7950661.1 bifunctional D-glycero-beta-D-manno-heptose-7-phosphate kinase/D-glycero-beta-D-manno-heptose 1-phosphate adenylyltransferase HldE [Lichenihabitans sp. Uapishka_5]